MVELAFTNPHLKDTPDWRKYIGQLNTECNQLVIETSTTEERGRKVADTPASQQAIHHAYEEIMKATSELVASYDDHRDEFGYTAEIHKIRKALETCVIMGVLYTLPQDEKRKMQERFRREIEKVMAGNLHDKRTVVRKLLDKVFRRSHPNASQEE